MKMRGTTLAELLVASGLMMLLLGLVFLAVTEGIRYQRRVEAQLDLDSKMLVTLAFLTRELSETQMDAVHCNPFSPDCVTFGVSRKADGSLAVDGQGRLLWDKVICYRVESEDGVNNLIRQEEMVGGDHLVPVSPASLAPPRDKDHFISLNSAKRRLATRVTNFSVTPIGRDQLNLELGTDVFDGRRTYGLKLATTVAPRN